jgi:aminoglycoside phosphotransferase (APT) family kinase protein
MPPEADALARRLAQTLGRLWEASVRIEGLARFHGGAARETWRFDAVADRRREALVVRRDPAASLIETSRSAEFHALARAHAAGVPTPEPLLLDPDGNLLGAPGFLMRELPGGRAPGLFEPDPYGATRGETGRQMFHALGRLHALVPDDADLAALPVQDAAARLAHWKADIARHARHPEPVASAAIRWLEAHLPPPSGPPALVHGDFRSGNILVGGDGAVLALLDWEMAHVGDPMEDLAWAMDPLWGHGMAGLVAGALPPDAAIATWEAASGRRFAPDSFAWWRLFAGVQGLAIWIASAAQALTGANPDPVLAFAGLYPYRFHNAEVARMMAEEVPWA